MRFGGVKMDLRSFRWCLCLLGTRGAAAFGAALRQAGAAGGARRRPRESGCCEEAVEGPWLSQLMAAGEVLPRDLAGDARAGDL